MIEQELGTQPQVEIDPQLEDEALIQKASEISEKHPIDIEEGVRVAGLGTQMAKFLGKKTAKVSRKELAKKGEKELAERTARELEPDIKVKTETLEAKTLEELDPTEPYQINFDTINNSDDIRKEIGILNEQNREAIQTQRRQVVPDEELKTLAYDLSSDPDTIKKVLGLKPGEILPPEYILSMKSVLEQSAGKLKELASQIKASKSDIPGIGVDPKTAIAFHKQWEFHSQFTKQFMGVRAEYGRGLRSLGISTEDAPVNDLMLRMSAGTLDPQSMADQILMAADTKSITQTIQNQKGMVGKASDVFNEIFINGILSGVQTHIVNSVSNVMRTVAMPLDIYVASFMKSGSAEMIQPGESLAFLKGAMEANKEAFTMAWKVIKTGEQHGGVSKLETDYAKAISANTLGIKEGTTAAWVTDKTGNIIRIPTANLMGAEDAFFKVLSERGKIRQVAHREAVLKGLVGDEYDNYVSYMMENPTRDMKAQAQQAGLEATFQSEVGKVGGMARTIRENIPGGRYIIPFVKTPINLVYEGFVERTPLALISKKYKTAIQKGGVEAQMAKAKMAVGTSVNSIMLGFAMNGEVTGSYPRDKKLREAMQDAGIKEDSFVFTDKDGNKEYVSYDRLEPYNSILKLYGNISQTIQFANLDGENPEAEKEFEKLAAGLTVALAEATVNQTFMKGLGDLIALKDNPNATGRMLEGIIQSSILPYSNALRTVRKEVDPVIRDAEGILEKIQNTVPGLSEDNIPKLNNFGDPVDYTNNVIPEYAKGFMEDKKDPVMNEVMRLAEVTKRVAVFKPRKMIGGYTLTNEEYHDYVKLSTKSDFGGYNLKKKLKQTISTSFYKSQSDFAKEEMLEMIRDSYYKAGKELLLQKYPHIRKYSMDKKEYKNKLLQGGM